MAKGPIDKAKPWDSKLVGPTLLGAAVYADKNMPPGTMLVIPYGSEQGPTLVDPYVFKKGDAVMYGSVVGKPGPALDLPAGDYVVTWDPDGAAKAKPLWGKVLAQDCADPGASTERWTCPWCGVNWLEKPTGDDVAGCPECGEFPLEGVEDVAAAVVAFNESLKAAMGGAVPAMVKLSDALATIAPAFTKAFKQMSSPTLTSEEFDAACELLLAPPQGAAMSGLQALVESNVGGASSPLTEDAFDAAAHAIYEASIMKTPLDP